MQISCLEDQDLVTIAVEGELEVYSLPEFSRLAESYLGGPARLVLDMERLEYIDSSGLGFLVTLHERLQRQSQSLRVVNLQPHVARVFRITRLDQILDICAVAEPAL